MREFFLSEDDWEMYECICGVAPVKMLVEDNFSDDWCGPARRPYYQLRGRPVTRERAMEILIRTESLWSWEFHEKVTPPGYVPSNLCRNSYYNIPLHWRTGWVHPDGTIGQNNMFGFKYAEINEIMRDLVPIADAFPYLDLFVGVSYYDEVLPEKEKWYLPEWKDYQKNGFGSVIEYGIWIHDKTIEIVNEGRARKLYQKYEKLYEVANKAVYESDYYTAQEPVELDWEYFRRSLELVGMSDSESFLSEYANRLKSRAANFPGKNWYDKVLASKAKFESGGK